MKCIFIFNLVLRAIFYNPDYNAVFFGFQAITFGIDCVAKHDWGLKVKFGNKT